MPESTPSPSAELLPRSILDCVVTFLTAAIESGYSAACWRACRNVHSLLHATQFAADGESVMATLVPRFCEVAVRRLQRCSSMRVPLAKPLILVIAVGFISFPEKVDAILCLEEEDGLCQGVLSFAEAMARLAESEADPGLSLESELKIAGEIIRHFFMHRAWFSDGCFQNGNVPERGLVENLVTLLLIVFL